MYGYVHELYIVFLKKDYPDMISDETTIIDIIHILYLSSVLHFKSLSIILLIVCLKNSTEDYVTHYRQNLLKSPKPNFQQSKYVIDLGTIKVYDLSEGVFA